MSQCQAQVIIGLAPTVGPYICVLQDGHEGPHQIAISSDFNLARAEDDVGGFGHCGHCQERAA
jgi:hypothetical protein